MEVSVKSFSTTYTSLDLQLYNKQPLVYEALLLIMEVQEYGRGFKATRIAKATNKGTIVQYEALKNNEDANAALKSMEDRNRELRERAKQMKTT